MLMIGDAEPLEEVAAEDPHVARQHDEVALPRSSSSSSGSFGNGHVVVRDAEALDVGP